MNLRVETDIPFGNACDVEISCLNGIPAVSFSPDPHGGPEALWFCFRVTDDDSSGHPTTVSLALKNTDNLLGGGRPLNFRPVVRESEGEWKRLAQGEVIEHDDGRRSVLWTIRASALPMDVAFCFPYGPDELDALAGGCPGIWMRDTIGVSQGARPIVRLSNCRGEPSGGRPGVYLIARQHSGETPGSWVMDGFLRRIAGAADAAPLVWAVPFANIDGVMQGDYGKDNFPFDLNRAWGTPPMRHETQVISRDVRRWQARCRPVLALDFHAPGGSENEGVYCFPSRPPGDDGLAESIGEWAERLRSALTGEFAAADFQRTGNYASRWNTPTFCDYLSEILRVPAISAETPYACIGERALDVEDYREIGRRMADAVLDACGC